MDGLLNIYKPRGWTSRRVVDHIAKVTRQRRVGHTGTLDPVAEGVLVVCLGKATRLAAYVQRMAKRYRGEFLLAHSSDTDDIEGEVRRWEMAEWPTLAQIQTAIQPLVGEILQRPPAYSAIKVKGERSYRRARRGESITLPPRPVRIDSIDIVRYEPPRLVLDITCHAGTYIRAVGRDLAETLGTQAVMSRLVRESVGEFRADDAISPESLVSREDVARRLLPLSCAVVELPHVRLSSEQIAEVIHGGSVHVAEVPSGSASELAALDEQGMLVALLVPRGRDWGPRKVFATTVTS